MMTESDLDRIIKAWATSYNEEVLQYAQPAAVNDSEVNSIMLYVMLLSQNFFLNRLKNIFKLFSGEENIFGFLIISRYV